MSLRGRQHAKHYVVTAVISVFTTAALGGGWGWGPVSHEPKHTGAAVPIPSRRLERVIWKGQYPVPAIFPPGTARIASEGVNLRVNKIYETKLERLHKAFRTCKGLVLGVADKKSRLH